MRYPAAASAGPHDAAEPAHQACRLGCPAGNVGAAAQVSFSRSASQAPPSGPAASVVLDEGTQQTTITGVTFKGRDFAGIDAFNTPGTNSFGGNTHQLGSGAGAARISYSHM